MGNYPLPSLVSEFTTQMLKARLKTITGVLWYLWIVIFHLHKFGTKCSYQT